MEPSLHLVPSQSATTSSISIASTANSLGIHDSIRHGGVRSLAAEVAPRHALDNRLTMWEEQQENLNLTLQRNMFGLHAPIRQLMERSIVSQNPVPMSFNGLNKSSNLSLDILLGKDETIEIKDVLTGDGGITNDAIDFHAAMEKKLRMF